MQAKALTGKKIAILAANGFEQDDMTSVQRALVAAGTMPTTISPEQGVLMSWHGTGWGHCFTVDAKIGEVLSLDYDVLIIPGGQRHIARLTSSLHTERIVSGFVDDEKPIIAYGEAAQILESCKCPDTPNVLRHIAGEDRAAFTARMMDFIVGKSRIMQKAA